MTHVGTQGHGATIVIGMCHVNRGCSYGDCSAQVCHMRCVGLMLCLLTFFPLHLPLFSNVRHLCCSDAYSKCFGGEHQSSSIQRQTRSRRWKRLDRTIGSNGARSTMAQRQMLYDLAVPFRRPFLVPMTRPVQEIYDEHVETFIHDTGISEIQPEHKQLVANSETAAQRLAFTNALYLWLENALRDSQQQLQIIAHSPTYSPRL